MPQTQAPTATSRPRRTPKTPARRAAAPIPSSAPPRVNASAIASANKVAKKRVRSTAVTASLVGRAARARTALAVQEEVV